MKEIRLYKCNDTAVHNAVMNCSQEGDPEKAELYLLEQLDCSDEAYVATVDGEVACIWGLQYQNLLLGHAYIWLYLTDVGRRNSFRFVRKSKELIDTLMEKHRYLNGWLDPRHSEAKPWMSFLGFKFPGDVGMLKIGGRQLPAQFFYRGER